MNAERPFRLALAAIVLAGLVLQLAALHPGLRGTLWGFHSWVFLPRWLAAAAWIATASGAFWLLAPERFRRLEAGIAWLATWRPPRALPVLLPLACGAAFWLLRSRQSVLGDASTLVAELPRGLAFHPRQPLAMALQQALFRAAGGWFAGGGAPAGTGGASGGVASASGTVAMASVLCGVLFAVVAWWLAGAIAARHANDRGATRALATALLLAQGYALLFYGYLENYAPLALAVGCYLALGLAHLSGGVPLVAPCLAFLAAVGLHLSAVAYAPSLVYLAARALRRTPTRTAAGRDLLLAAVAAVALDRWLASMSPGYGLWRGITGILVTAAGDQGGGAGVGYLLSARHLRDLANDQYLIGPLAGVLFVPALGIAAARGAWRDVPLLFLSLAAGTLLLASASTSDPALGYARDWDLYAPAGVSYAVAALALLVATVPAAAARLRLLLVALVVSAAHLTAWVGVNVSEERAMARFVTLPLGQGRTEVVVGNWHQRHGRIDAAVAWFEKALRADARNSNAWAFLGQVAAERGDMPRAAEAFGRAMALRPDKLLYRHNHVKALEALGRWHEVLPHYEVLCAREPQFAENWLGRGRALLQLGRAAAARPNLEQFLRMAPTHPSSNDVRRWLSAAPAGTDQAIVPPATASPDRTR